jgi:hypothetical protein
MPDAYERIKLDDVDLDEDFYSCSFPLFHPALAGSIRRWGIIRPVQLVRGKGRYVVVSGLRRVRAAHECGLVSIPSRILAPPHPPAGELFIRNLEDNLASRPLNLFERARAVRRLAGEVEGLEQSLREQYLQILGTGSGQNSMSRLVALDGLADRVKEYALARNLPDHIAFQLTGLQAAESLNLVELAERIRFTASQLRDVLHFGREIADRDDLDFQAVLRSLEEGVDPSLKDASRRRSAFLEHLQRERLPDYRATRSRLEACLAKINGAPGIHVGYPPYLEGDELTARISFRTPEELAARARTLLVFASGESLAKAFELFG